MNLDVTINKTTCFYYWVQVISNWDSPSIDRETYQYYTNNLSEDYQPTLEKIRTILQAAEEPRWALAELYSENASLREAKEIEALAKPLEVAFEPVWEESLPHLKKWETSLSSTDFTQFIKPMQEIRNFLDSRLNLQNTQVLYLVQNPPGHRATGLAISETNFILIRPPTTGKQIESKNIQSVIAHEYIHAIERESITRELFKKSFDKYIRTSNIPSPGGYTWKMMFVETIVYCFASTVIRGYLSQNTYSKPRPTITEMEDGFQRLLQRGDPTTVDVINWVALNILSEVEEYIEEGKKIDQRIADKIGEQFLKFYLT